MFPFFFIIFAVPGALIVGFIAAFLVKRLQLMPDGMSFDWLTATTMGLAAGGAVMGFAIEEFIVRPIQLQNELVGRQLVTPLSLRHYSAWGFQDVVWRWVYEIEPATAARLARSCRPDPGPRMQSCDIAGTYREGPGAGGGRAAFIYLEGTTLTIVESVD